MQSFTPASTPTPRPACPGLSPSWLPSASVAVPRAARRSGGARTAQREGARRGRGTSRSVRQRLHGEAAGFSGAGVSGSWWHSRWHHPGPRTHPSAQIPLDRLVQARAAGLVAHGNAVDRIDTAHCNRPRPCSQPPDLQGGRAIGTRLAWLVGSGLDDQLCRGRARWRNRS